MSDFYTWGGNPGSGTEVTSADVQSELKAIQAGFDKFPPWLANPKKALRINSAGSAVEAVDLDFGFYTPLFQTGTGVITGATFSVCRWVRVGPSVLVYGSFLANYAPQPSLVSATFDFDLPIPSVLGVNAYVVGGGNAQSPGLNNSVINWTAMSGASNRARMQGRLDAPPSQSGFWLLYTIA